jgi:hypothetical protein
MPDRVYGFVWLKPAAFGNCRTSNLLVNKLGVSCLYSPQPLNYRQRCRRRLVGSQPIDFLLKLRPL